MLETRAHRAVFLPPGAYAELAGNFGHLVLRGASQLHAVLARGERQHLAQAHNAFSQLSAPLEITRV